MYFMSDPQALHVTRNVIPGKLGVDLHLHRLHIPLVCILCSHCCLLDVLNLMTIMRTIAWRWHLGLPVLCACLLAVRPTYWKLLHCALSLAAQCIVIGPVGGERALFAGVSAGLLPR